MANASFTSFKDALLNATVDLNDAVIKVALVRGYTFDASHQFLSQVTATGTLNGTPVALTSKTIVGGAFDADDSIITTTANASNHNIIVYQASAVTGGADVPASSQALCFFYDTGTNLPVVPGTGTVTITWSSIGKIYKIG